MKLQQRIQVLSELGKYLLEDAEILTEIKQKAEFENPWFSQLYIDLAVENIAKYFLNEDILKDFSIGYKIETKESPAKKIGIIMAGNIPLVGFHDLLCVFLSGHIAMVKTSSKDNVLMTHIIKKLIDFKEEVSNHIFIAERLTNCDAYIATGSNHSAKHFEYYFSKVPHLIRRNRTSVAILTGNESETDLQNLANDVHLYFGLGCRNVTKIYVPKDYDFLPLLTAFTKYNSNSLFHKFKNNYDYQLSILILNNQYYMSNDSIILSENKSEFSPISVLHYAFYENLQNVLNDLKSNENIQCIVGKNYTNFGASQYPKISDFADGVNTMNFLLNI